MMDPKLLLKQAYHYDLPQELIAQFPTEERSASRLMHLACQEESIYHRNFSDLPQLLKSGDVLVLNNSRVFPARLFGYKSNGTKIQVLLLHPGQEKNSWDCLVQPGKRIKTAQWISFAEGFKAYLFPGSDTGIYRIVFDYEGDFWEHIHRLGHIPLPPYIAREDVSSDKERYQTVYAKELGSVAAPTAGLHFTPQVFEELNKMGVIVAELTLHVGIGTFLPVKTENILDHVMHSECVEITSETAAIINSAKLNGKRVIAVGTTSTRSLESFWENGALQHGTKWTNIFIYPGYQFQVPDAMITNLHLPESTLLMMISAFAGYEFIKKAYAVAVAERYRFFSYGDAMFIEL